MIEYTDLKKLRQHCNDLSKALFYLEMHDKVRWSQAAEWLEIASGITNIDFDLTVFNDAYGWCSAADDYHNRREFLLKRFITEVSVFNFIWGSLESLIDLLELPEHPQHRGKINSACYFLKCHLSEKLPFYIELLDKIKVSFSEINNYKDILTEFKLRPHVDVSGVSLFVIYKIRNRLAHGALFFPEPSEDTDESADIYLIQLCSRLVLLTIQMLVYAYLKSKNIIIRIDRYSPLDFNITGVNSTINSIIRGVHINIVEEDEKQISFDFINPQDYL